MNFVQVVRPIRVISEEVKTGTAGGGRGEEWREPHTGGDGWGYPNPSWIEGSQILPGTYIGQGKGGREILPMSSHRL